MATLRPLFAWKSGAQGPDAERLSVKSRSRWCRLALPTEVYVASPQAACRLGSSASGIAPFERRDHDIRLAAVYIHHRRMHPRLANLWIGRDALPKAGYRLRDPDVLLRHSNGRILRAIQVAGRWNPDQVASFHEYCVESDLPYELW